MSKLGRICSPVSDQLEGWASFSSICLLELLSFLCSSLRIAEDVLKEGVLIKSFPPESYTIKCLDDAWALLDTEDGQERMEGYLKTWMKSIQDLLVESEQLRIENDKNGPQVEVEYWKTRAAKLTLLVEQIISMPCKMTLVTLRAGKCKLLKVNL